MENQIAKVWSNLPVFTSLISVPLYSKYSFNIFKVVGHLVMPLNTYYWIVSVCAISGKSCSVKIESAAKIPHVTERRSCYFDLFSNLEQFERGSYSRRWTAFRITDVHTGSNDGISMTSIVVKLTFPQIWTNLWTCY